jgi:hypothetical protein
MVDVRPRVFLRDVSDLARARHLHVPHRRWGTRHQDQKQTRWHLVRAQILLSDLVFVVSGRTVQNWNMVGLGPRPQPSAETACHAHQVSVIEVFIGTLQCAPPAAEAASINTFAEVRIQDDAVHAIVASFQKIFVLLTQRVCHAVVLPQHQQATAKLVRVPTLP